MHESLSAKLFILTNLKRLDLYFINEDVLAISNLTKLQVLFLQQDKIMNIDRQINSTEKINFKRYLYT